MIKEKENRYFRNVDAFLGFLNPKLSGRGILLSWILVLSTVGLIHSFTFIISPTLWRDEAQIIEHGRLIRFDPHSEWSMNWSSAANRPLLMWSYLGPALQETAFRITTPLPFGPRIASVLGAMIAATASLGWLLAMKTFRPIALILGLVFLLDYMFVQSYRGARVDCWVLAFCFGSCWLTRYAMSRMQEGRPFRWALTLAGGMAAIGFFVWPSAVLIYPLVLAELLVLLRQENSIRKSGSSVGLSVLAFVSGGLMTISLLLIPIWHLLKTMFNDVVPILRASQPAYSLSLQMTNLLDSLKFSQLLPVGAVIGFIWGRGRMMASMAILVFVYILSTLLYLNRLIYLMPYAIGLIGAAYQMPLPLFANAKTRRLITHLGLVLVIVGSVSSALIIRPAIALSQKRERDPSGLFRLGLESIGTGPHLVYLGAWDFYFPGRWLGWHMLNGYDDQEHSELFSRAEHAIFPIAEVDDKLGAQLLKAGLYFQKQLTDDRQDSMDVRYQFRLGAQGYGPYALYSRKLASEGQ